MFGRAISYRVISFQRILRHFRSGILVTATGSVVPVLCAFSPYGEYDYSHPTDGAFPESGAFRVLPPIPTGLLVEQFRHVVLNYLLEDEPITEAFTAQKPGS